MARGRGLSAGPYRLISSGFPVVAGKDTRAGPLLRGQSSVNAEDDECRQARASRSAL